MKNPFQFCPKCQKPLNKNINRLIKCKYCQFNFYINPAPTNGLILENKNGEILLTKRKYPPKKGYWDIPGGFINFKETAEQSLIREIKEELGIELKNFYYFGNYFDDYFYKNINYKTLCFIFIKKDFQGKIFPNDDVIEAKFFNKKEIDFKKIAFKSIKQVIIDYLSAS